MHLLMILPGNIDSTAKYCSLNIAGLSLTWFLLFLLCTGCKNESAGTKWEIYRGNAESNCYSALDEINTGNVNQLKIAWTFHTGDSGAAIQCNPIVVNGVMYVTSPGLKVMALDAATGHRIWTSDPCGPNKKVSVNRGLTYWQEGSDRRIFFAAGSELFALNAETGKIIPDFANKGAVDLRVGLDRNVDSIYFDVSSPGIIFNDLIIIGSTVSEGEGAAPGHVRAYNVKTGKQEWVFHTIPQPGEFGYETWEKDAWKNIGGANVWSGFSLDKKRGLVFFGTGSCSPDLYGRDRKGQNLFANSVVALDASNGKRKWHYQLVHHDLWDYDIPTPPNLVTVNHNGQQRDAVAQLSKTGDLFLLDRETGEPLFDVEERKVPVSDVEGEASSPTQPFPVKPAPFVRQQYTLNDISDISPSATEFCKTWLSKLDNEGIFTPPSVIGSLVIPGVRGGAEWNGGSFDPETGIIYVNANEIPYLSALNKVKVNSKNESGKELYQLYCASCHGADRNGYPPFPSILNISEKMSRENVSNQIINGKGQMPPFPNLKDNQINKLVSYLYNEESDKGKTNTEKNYDTAFNYASARDLFTDPEGYPAIKPPWGTLSAIDLNTGYYVWKVPLGEYPELTKRGILVTGTQNFGGTVVTAGGLIFVGATKDEMFRAIDKQTGKILWETKLPAGGYATPATYELDGKQFVVIAAGGGGKNGTKKGDLYIAFSLPH